MRSLEAARVGCVRASVALVLALAAGCGHKAVVPATVPELGAFSKPSVVTGRDGGAAAMIGGRMFWTFADTLMTVYGVDGFNFRSSTGGWGTGTGLTLEEQLDANGAPYQLVPYTAAEVDYNRSGGPNERFAMWPGSVVATGPDSGLIFYMYIKLHPGYLVWDRLGAGVARIKMGQTVATRDPGLLFAAPVRGFAVGSIVVNGYLYLYSCDPTPCPVARAPFDQATVQSAWQVWDGAAWSSDMTTGKPVLDGVPGELTVSWNPYLNSYLAVHSVPFSSEVVFNTAPQPEGPWSPAQHLFTGRSTQGSADYGAKEHPELAGDGGRSLVVGYANPAASFGGEIRLALPTLP